MAKIIKLNQPQYAKKMQVSKVSISYRIKHNIPLPGVVKIEKILDWYILHFEESTDLKEARKSFKKLLA